MVAIQIGAINNLSNETNVPCISVTIWLKEEFACIHFVLFPLFHGRMGILALSSPPRVYWPKVLYQKQEQIYVHTHNEHTYFAGHTKKIVKKLHFQLTFH